MGSSRLWRRLNIGTKQIETLEEIKKVKLDLVVTLGGDGTTLRVFRNLENDR